MFYSDLTPFGVDMERLAKNRLARLQAAMKRENLGALLLTDFLNIRYATNTVMMLERREGLAKQDIENLLGGIAANFFGFDQYL